MAVIGNFRSVGGVDRTQLAVLSLGSRRPLSGPT